MNSDTFQDRRIKHTPGPWQACGQDGCIRIRATDVDGATVYPATINGNAEDDEHGPTTRANAELVAAAPSLLEALRELVEAFPTGEDGMAVAGEFGADSELNSARVLLYQIDNDLL